MAKKNRKAKVQNTLGRFNWSLLGTGKSQKTLSDDGQQAQSVAALYEIERVCVVGSRNFHGEQHFFLDGKNKVMAS
jgi:hypothetical protein